MKSCPSCGATAEPAARFCLECGHAFEEDVGPAAADPWSGRLVAGRYRLLGKLGDGGMGEVFRAEQLPMGRQVALKILKQSLADDAQAVERFKREAQAASQLSHPNTITVHDFGQDDDGTLFIAMELLAGQGLDRVLGDGTVLRPDRTVAILAQVCGSLAEAHGRGLVHRDLKPENIMLITLGEQPDYVKVLDFGIAKVTQSSRGDRLETITRAGAIFGTPQYMAPEQIRGEEIDARADVYALGVVLYQMIAGQLPFAASTVVEMLTKHLSAQPAPITREHGSADDVEAFARLEAVALRALSKDPNQRQASARAFLEDLMAAMPHVVLNPLTGMMPQTAPPSPALTVDAIAAPGRTTSPLTTVLIAAILAGLAGAGFLFMRNSPPPPSGAAPAVLAQAADEGGEPAAQPEGEAPAEGDAKPEGDTPAAAAGGDEAGDAKPEGGTAEGGDEAAEGGDEAAEGGDEAADGGDAPPADTPMTDDEAKAVAAQADADAKAADAAKKAAEAEEKAKAAQQKATQAEETKKAAEAAKKAAEADKAAAMAAKKAAEAEKLAAQEAAAEAKAKAAEASADKAAAMAELEKARAARKAMEAEKSKADAATAAAQADADKAKAEAAALKAQLQQIEDEKAAAAAKAEEQRVKAEEAKAKAKAAKKKKRPKVQFGNITITGGQPGEKVFIDNRMRGKVPMRRAIRVKAGRHAVKVGGRAKSVTVGGGKTVRVKF